MNWGFEQAYSFANAILLGLAATILCWLMVVVWKKAPPHGPLVRRLWTGVRRAPWTSAITAGIILVCILVVVIRWVIALQPSAFEPNGGDSITSTPSAVPSSTPTPIVETEVRQLNPVSYDGTLRDGYEVTEGVSGQCDESSLLLNENPNAYRCSFPGSVADPCYAFAEGMSVFCVSGAWDQQGTQVNLEEPVAFDPTFNPPVLDDEHLLPWAIEVVDPRDATQSWQCLALTGATTEIAGNRASWSCSRADGSGDARALNTLIITDDPVWRVLFYDPDEADLIEADVAKLWN